ncbi:hypothetical protein, partial [Streptomyces zhihengii]
MADNNPYRLVTNLKYWLLASGGLVAGVALLYVSGLPFFEDHKSFGTLANQLGGLLIASVALATLWDLVGRRSFFREMLEVLGLKHDVHTSGLESIGTDYRKVVGKTPHQNPQPPAQTHHDAHTTSPHDPDQDETT